MLPPFLIIIGLLLAPLIASHEPPKTTAFEDDCIVSADGQNQGLCNSPDGHLACDRYCRRVLKDGYKSYECTSWTDNGLKECRCVSACAIATIYGDPHYVGFDGTSFEFQGTCPHLLVRPAHTVASLPNYAVYLTNTEWHRRDDVSIPHTVEIAIPEWSLNVTLGETFQVNGTDQSLPYVHSELRNGIQSQFLEVISSTSYHSRIGYVDVLKVRTSFGLLILIEQSFLGDESRANGVYVKVPSRHPWFYENTFGILGFLDGDTTNDLVTAHGWPLGNSPSTYALWMFGESFCKTKSVITPSAVKMMHIKAHQHRIDACNGNSAKRDRMSRLCDQQVRRVLESCLGSVQLERAVQACNEDVCYSVGPAEEQMATCNAIRAHSIGCSNIKSNCL